MSFAYFEEVYRTFLEAEHNTSAVDRFYTIAGHTFRLRFAGQALVPYISPALEHLATERVPAQAFTVCLWDSASTDTKIPPFPWKGDNNIASKKIHNRKENINPRIYFKDEYIHGVYHIGTNTLSMLDTKLNLAIFWVPDACQIPYYESSAPLRAIVQWWAHNHGLQFAHAGAVGTSDGGVLLAGTSGSGKSSTALACLNSGLAYAGDDYVLLSADPVPYLYSLYNSCKLNVADIERFPRFLPAIINSKNLDREKALIFLHDFSPEKVAIGFRIRAVLLPKVAGITKTRLKKVSPATGLETLAPSTILQSLGAGQEELKWMAKFIRQVPSYILELGEDTHKIPDIILDLLSKG